MLFCGGTALSYNGRGADLRGGQRAPRIAPFRIRPEADPLREHSWPTLLPEERRVA